MMTDQEMNERLHKVFLEADESALLKAVCEYAVAVRLCQQHQFTAAAEGLLCAAERMVGITHNPAPLDAGQGAKA
jgi:hypothetical protein